MNSIKKNRKRLLKSAEEMINTGYELINIISEKYGIWSNISHIGNTNFGFKKENFDITWNIFSRK